MSRRAVVAPLVLAAGTSWNISNVGAVADPLAEAYGVSLATIGLFTTAVFASQLVVMLPAGRGSDRLGARRVGLVALGVIVAGNVALLVEPSPALALAARAVVGLGGGAGFIAGADYMRSASPSPFLQGLYGAAGMGGGGVAVAVVPQLEPLLDWRAPYWSALAVAAGTAVVLATAPPDRRGGALGARAGVLADRRLMRLGVLHAATFGFAVVAANWVVPLLERQGHDRTAAAALGALVLLAGIVTRPLGGLLLRGRPERRRPLAAVAIVTGAAGFALLALPLPLAVLGLATAAVGLASGLPFALVFSGAQATRPDAPGAAIAFVNAWAISAVVIGTPLLGLAFSLPGDGRIGFACVGAIWVAALLALPRR